MAVNLKIALTVVAQDTIISTESGFLPEVEVSNKTISDTASDLFENITSLKVIRDYSGWVCLKAEGFLDEPLRMKNEQREVVFLYSVFLPEKIKIKEGYQWLSIKKIMSSSQKMIIEKVLS